MTYRTCAKAFAPPRTEMGWAAHIAQSPAGVLACLCTRHSWLCVWLWLGHMTLPCCLLHVYAACPCTMPGCTRLGIVLACPTSGVLYGVTALPLHIRHEISFGA